MVPKLAIIYYAFQFKCIDMDWFSHGNAKCLIPLPSLLLSHDVTVRVGVYDYLQLDVNKNL